MKDHLAMVRELPCCLRGFDKCSGPVEAHHVLKGGMSKKGSNLSAAPLCMLHHQRIHANVVPMDWTVEVSITAIRLAVETVDFESATILDRKAMRMALSRAVQEVVDQAEALQ